MKTNLTLAIPLLWLAVCGTAVATNTVQPDRAPTVAAVPTTHHHLSSNHYPSAGADPLATAVAQPGSLLLLPLGILGLAWSQRRRNP